MIPLRLVAEAMRRRGEEDEADYLEWVIPFELMILHDFSYDEVMDMDVGEAEAWYRTPPKPSRYDGWNFWWGSKA